jgi:hypothetical protein
MPGLKEIGLVPLSLNFALCLNNNYCVSQDPTEQLTDSSSTTDLKSTASPMNVEKILKNSKTHRCAMDFDSTFCKAVFHNDNGEMAAVHPHHRERAQFSSFMCHRGQEISVVLVNEISSTVLIILYGSNLRLRESL